MEYKITDKERKIWQHYWGMAHTTAPPLSWESNSTDKRFKGWNKVLKKAERDTSNPTKG